MLRLKRIDFVRPRFAFTPLACVLFAGVVGAGLWVGNDFVRVRALDEDVTLLQQRVDARQRLMNKAKQDEKKAAPEQRKIDAVVNAQAAAKASGTVPLLQKIGQAWTPQVAMLSVSVQRAGKEAKISGEAQDLGEVYAFVGRLQADNALRAMLTRHGVKTGDSRLAITFDISVEQR
jgi:hypothetical protein